MTDTPKNPAGDFLSAEVLADKLDELAAKLDELTDLAEQLARNQAAILEWVAQWPSAPASVRDAVDQQHGG